MTNICKKNQSELESGNEGEQIWYDILNQIFDMKLNDLFNRKLTHKRILVQKYFLQRINIFIFQLVDYINFNNLLDWLTKNQPQTKFIELQFVIYDIFQNLRYEQIILDDAKQSIFDMDSDLYKQYVSYEVQGILFRCRKCQIC